MKNTPYCTINEAFQQIINGKMLIITDANDREDEGDLFIPAQDITPEHVNFMIRYGRGLICAPISQQKAEKFNLPLMIPAEENEENTRCNFTISIDARQGISTGISAHDRAITLQLLANEDTAANDFVRPGHIFPLIAKPGGIQQRAGHTEASLALCKHTNKKPAAVICEVIGDDGKMLRGASLEKFAQKHQLSIISIAQIKEYQETHETKK